MIAADNFPRHYERRTQRSNLKVCEQFSRSPYSHSLLRDDAQIKKLLRETKIANSYSQFAIQNS